MYARRHGLRRRFSMRAAMSSPPFLPVPPAPTGDAAVPHVACLCAAWCRLCDGYAAVFEQVTQALAREHPGLRVHWIDIEDQAALLGDLDIETFPTLLAVNAAGAVCFAGVLTPQPEVLQRVLAAALAGPPPATAPDPAYAALAQRLRDG